MKKNLFRRFQNAIYVTFFAIFGILSSFVYGLAVVQYKLFPFNEIKQIRTLVRDVFPKTGELIVKATIEPSIQYAEYMADRPRMNYPHLRVLQDQLNNTLTAKVNIRSDSKKIPDRINLFDPLTGSLQHTIEIEEFIVREKPLQQCKLMDHAKCVLYADYTIQFPAEISGDFLITFENSINERSLEPVADFIKINPQDTCKIGVVYPDFTFIAYNAYGGHSLYSEPFPVPGQMESSYVAYDRPMYSNDITKTYFPTNIIARKISEMDIGCVGLESNSSLSDDRLSNYDLMVLAGHDEYWTKNLTNNINAYVRNGGSLAVFSGNTNFRRIQIDNNRVNRTQYSSKIMAPELITGLACRYGCMPVSSIEFIPEANRAGFETDFDLKGMKVLMSEHPIFEGTNLKNGDYFGREVNLIWYEIDGAPLDDKNGTIRPDIKPRVTPSYDGESKLSETFQAETVVPLASTHLAYFKSNETQYAATIVEYINGLGRVINAGSVGWFKALLEKDTISSKIFENIIVYQLKDIK